MRLNKTALFFLFLFFTVASFLSGCEDILALFAKCRPTEEQEWECQDRYDWNWTAEGRPGTDGTCGWNEFLCKDLETGQVAAPLTCGEDGGFGGFSGECQDENGGADGGINEEPDAGNDNEPEEPDAGN